MKIPPHNFDPDNLPTPTRLIDTIETIKALRELAWWEWDNDNYDPLGYTRMRVEAFRKHADKLEAEMEKRIGWVL